MATRAFSQLVVVTLTLVALAACGLPGMSQLAASSTPQVSAVLPSGIYSDRIVSWTCLTSGPPPASLPPKASPSHCQLHAYEAFVYQIVLTDTGAQTFRGTIGFVATDGNTSALLTFTATSESGITTLTVGAGPNDGQGPP